MKILELTASNFKRIKAISIKPDGNSVIVSGKNGAGKSSVLDAIVVALCGGRTIPDKPIRYGEKKAEIVVETDEIVIKRSFSLSGSQLEITAKDGSKVKSPQALLDGLVGKISFDPLEFMRMKSVDQRKLLLDMIGIRFDDIDTKLAQVRSDKVTMSRDAARAEKELEGIKVEKVEEVDPNDIMRQVIEANEINNKIDTIEFQIQQRQEQLRDYEAKIKTLKASIDDLIRDQFELERVDVSELSDKLSKVKEQNQQAQAWKRYQHMKGNVEALRSELERRKQEEAVLVTERANRLNNAKMPISGLSVSDDGIIFDSIPLSQVNTAKALEVCLAISMSLNPQMKVIRINGNDLDEESLKAVCNMADDADYQLWIEKVDSTGKVGIVIEDGSVVEVNK